MENIMICMLKKAKVKSNLFISQNMLLMVGKGIIGGVCHSIYQYAKTNNKYMKDCDKNEESSCLQYWDVNSLYLWNMSLKLPVKNFEWIKGTS